MHNHLVGGSPVGADNRVLQVERHIAVARTPERHSLAVVAVPVAGRTHTVAAAPVAHRSSAWVLVAARPGHHMPPVPPEEDFLLEHFLADSRLDCLVLVEERRLS